MTCRDYCELLSALMDGELSSLEERLLHEHLDNCEECRAEHRRMLRLQEAVQKLDVPEVPVNLWEGIQKRLSSPKETRYGRNGKIVAYPTVWRRLTRVGRVYEKENIRMNLRSHVSRSGSRVS